jgi:glycosyltransferase involved in cell wall biosynthesis
MKIFHVETGRHFYGGAQQVIWLTEGLAARGVDCVLVCPPASDIDSAARAAGLEVTNLSCAGDLDISFAWRLRQLLVQAQPDVVHCHSRRGADFLGGQAAAMAGIPAVVSRRVDSIEGSAISALRYRPFVQVVAISEHIASVLLAAGMSGRRLIVIRSAVDAKNLPSAAFRGWLEAEFGIGPGEIAIAIAAQLIRRKGHHFLFEALSDPQSELQQLRLVVFGTGTLEAELKARVANLGLSDRVHFAGFRKDIDRLLPAFDMLAHPATEEGLGVAMLKASAARLPVVAFDVAGAREAVLHEKTGLLVAAGDVRGLRRAIVRLAGDAELRKTLGDAGRKRMLDEFSVREMIDKHMQLYEAIIDG